MYPYGYIHAACHQFMRACLSRSTAGWRGAAPVGEILPAVQAISRPKSAAPPESGSGCAALKSGSGCAALESGSGCADHDDGDSDSDGDGV